MQLFTVFGLRPEVESRRGVTAASPCAPRSVEAIQQTVVTLVQGYVNHPEVSRPRAIEAIKFLNQPMWRTQIVDLRRAYKEFQRSADINALLGAVETIRGRFGPQHSEQQAAALK